MSKFTRGANLFSTAVRTKEILDQRSAVENSNLEPAEKRRAMKSHNKMITITIIFVIAVVILMSVATIYGLNRQDETGMFIILTAMIVAVVVLVVFALVARKFFQDWTKALDTVQRDFDGLSEQERRRLEPDEAEQKIVTYYRRKELVCSLIFLLVLAVEIFLVVKFNINYHHIIPLGILVVTVGAWYVIQDAYVAEINRLRSGFYKKGFGYNCSKCGETMTITFTEAIDGGDWHVDDAGDKAQYCAKCGNLVKLYSFDTYVKDYRKYLELLEKYRRE